MNRVRGDSRRRLFSEDLTVGTNFFLILLVPNGQPPNPPPFSKKQERLAGSPIEALALAATNEYGEFDRRAAALYAVDMVVEPHRETKISVLEPNFGERSLRFRWLLVRASETGIPLDYVEAEVDAKGGAFATVTLTEPGETYALLVQQVSQDGSVTAEGRATVVCKYVRREIRDLTDADRTAFFKAMQEFYTVPLEQGKERYGVDFANAKRVAAFHNSEVSGATRLESSIASAGLLFHQK